jgi:MHS family shikimate/dehydroshikimate transporter-like MFS transporter
MATTDDDTPPADADAGTGARAASSHRRALLSSFIGSVVEWYDFLLYGTASALVFGPLFFSPVDGPLALVFSFATLALGYVIRPLGGIVFGHFGDRIGRKSMLTITIVMMGSASALIGLLPTYDQIGALAPVLLIVLRLVQGFAVGGEWGGAVLMGLEHAPGNRRGRAGAFAQMGAPAGTLLSTGLLTLFSLLPEEQFLAWGWRIPFLISVVLLLVGVWIRRTITESPQFLAAEKTAQAPERKAPIVEVLAQHKRHVLAAALIGLGPFMHNGIMIAFVVAYGRQVGVATSASLTGLILSSTITLFTLPAFAALSDRIGRRPVTMTAGVLLAVNAFVMFALVNTGNASLFLLTYVISGIIHSAMYGPMAAFMAEMFPTTSRYTGTSLGYQIASVLGGGFGPLLATGLLAAAGGAPHTELIATLIAISCLATVVTSWIVAESAKRRLPGTETPSANTSTSSGKGTGLESTTSQAPLAVAEGETR